MLHTESASEALVEHACPPGRARPCRSRTAYTQACLALQRSFQGSALVWAGSGEHLLQLHRCCLEVALEGGLPLTRAPAAIVGARPEGPLHPGPHRTGLAAPKHDAQSSSLRGPASPSPQPSCLVQPGSSTACKRGSPPVVRVGHGVLPGPVQLHNHRGARRVARGSHQLVPHLLHKTSASTLRQRQRPQLWAQRRHHACTT